MRMGLVAVGLAVMCAGLAGCSGTSDGDEVTSGVGVAMPQVSPSVRALPALPAVEGSPAASVLVENQSSTWSQQFGDATSSGKLVVTALCEDGFGLTITTVDSKRFKDTTEMACDGGAANYLLDEPADGPVTVSVSTKNRTARWSARVSRG